jgi:hypothetical protein
VTRGYNDQGAGGRGAGGIVIILFIRYCNIGGEFETFFLNFRNTQIFFVSNFGSVFFFTSLLLTNQHVFIYYFFWGGGWRGGVVGGATYFFSSWR